MTARLEFSRKVRMAAFDRAAGRCEGRINGDRCGADISDGRCDYDHILPAALGGKAELANCQCLCIACHKAKTASDVRGIRKADRQRAARANAKPEPKQRIAGRGFPKRDRVRIEKLPLPPRRPMWIDIPVKRGGD